MTRWKSAFVATIIAMYGFTASIVWSTSTGHDKLAMLVPGAVMFGIGAFVVAAAANHRVSKGDTSEQDPAKKNWWEKRNQS